MWFPYEIYNVNGSFYVQYFTFSVDKINPFWRFFFQCALTVAGSEVMDGMRDASILRSAG